MVTSGGPLGGMWFALLTLTFSIPRRPPEKKLDRTTSGGAAGFRFAIGFVPIEGENHCGRPTFFQVAFASEGCGGLIFE
jgi:hypothetical protein